MQCTSDALEGWLASQPCREARGPPGDCREHWRDTGAADSHPFPHNVLWCVAVPHMATPVGICAAQSHPLLGTKPETCMRPVQVALCTIILWSP